MTGHSERSGAGRVVVVGSIHHDVQIDVPRLPGPGETVLGTGHRQRPGGKGANQAVAAAMTGAEVTLVGRVGDDAEGAAVRTRIEQLGVDTTHVRVDLHASTGFAFITVDRAGENQIAVSAGASGRLSPVDVERVAPVIALAHVLLIQLEVPLETIEAAVEHAGPDTIVVLNPAPARELPARLLARTTVLVPNVVELRQLSGHHRLTTVPEVVAAARSLPDGPAAVVTLGAHGALLVHGETSRHVAAEPVEVVDSTGAGDAFCGALASALAAGYDLEIATRRATRFATYSTTRPGALDSYQGGAGLDRSSGA